MKLSCVLFISLITIAGWISIAPVEARTGFAGRDPDDMAMRKHVEFVKEQDLAWLPFNAAGSPAGRSIKYLSQGDGNPSFTALVKYPPGYLIEGDGHYADEAELFILSGEMTVAGKRLGALSYIYIPAGADFGPVESPGGALVIEIHEGNPDLIRADASSRGRGKLKIIDTTAMNFEPSTVPGEPGGLNLKVLRVNEKTGEMTFLCSCIPWWESKKVEFHPCVEEAYVIQGDIWMGNTDKLGAMTTGSYFWRPPYYSHGPFYTKQGFVAFIRVNGRLANFFPPKGNGATPEENRKQAEAETNGKNRSN